MELLLLRPGMAECDTAGLSLIHAQSQAAHKGQNRKEEYEYEANSEVRIQA
jgi:hypothetical protein